MHGAVLRESVAKDPLVPSDDGGGEGNVLSYRFPDEGLYDIDHEIVVKIWGMPAKGHCRSNQ